MPETLPFPKRPSRPVAPDQAERSRALDPTRSFLVQAPAGSGKTYLLTQRFLRLLALAEKPDEIVAITFTNAAAAEMRNRILGELEKAEQAEEFADWDADDPESLPALAKSALDRSKLLGWQILDQPGQLRITTIDAFCRGLALQSPLSWGMLSGLGGRLDPVNNPKGLYRRAATRTIEQLQGDDSSTRRSVEELLLWRDNNWKDVEDLIVEMLGQRNRWYQEFVFARDGDWEALRRQLEAPFCRAARHRLERLARLLDEPTEARERALELARFSCATPGKSSPLSLAERAELPARLVLEAEVEEAMLLEDAVASHRELAAFLLTQKSEWRSARGLSVHHGFPAGIEGRAAKIRFGELVHDMRKVRGLQEALADFQQPMPVRYTDEEWELIRHCFAVLRVAAGHLQVVFAETGSVDFTEVAQIALRILAPENGFPSDFAMRQADSIHHLLIDEFQDTSRNQHQLLSRLMAAWPEREGRSCFCVGDPMQSIYGFREAEVELFERLKTHGLEAASYLDTTPFQFEFISLRSNFRTTPSLVEDLNGHFTRIFEDDDGSGVRFNAAVAARSSQSLSKTELHLEFTRRGKPADSKPVTDNLAGESELTRKEQLGEIVELIKSKLQAMLAVREAGSEKYRIAVLGRTKNSLILVADALREASIGFRAIDLVPLRERPEVLDVLSLARALLNPTDRVSWLGVLRAPWCGLSLQELHLLTSADDPIIGDTPVPILLELRLPLLFSDGLIDQRAFAAAARVGRVMRNAAETRAAAATSSLGTWLESVWKALGGDDTVDAEQRQNLRLLWASLDKLEEGELDLMGPGLNASLDELCALPDPAASSDFGVQLMTIHKSKGLEFEVVIVPDLEIEGKKFDRSMISWLERGLESPESSSRDETGSQLTEFLIAPIQAKGEKATSAKAWVDRVKRKRETQELRRLLYVAATRAREELHLFARPRFTVSHAGRHALANPSGLLATAWPAFGEEVKARFAEWIENLPEADAELTTLAAEAEPVAPMSNLLQMPSSAPPTIRPTLVRRLPEGYVAGEVLRTNASPSARDSLHGQAEHGQADEATGTKNQESLFTRTEGGLHSRLRGTAIHSLLERLSHLRESMSAAKAAEVLKHALPAVTATIRSHGLPARAARQLADEALTLAQRASIDPIGEWILAPHSKADSETRWTGLIQGQTWNLRPDRIFFAPAIAALVPDAPLFTGINEPVWWVIDYKNSQAHRADLTDPAERQSFLTSHRSQHEGQLATYAQVLRGLLGGNSAGSTIPVCAGIYYPHLSLFDFWEA